MGTKWPFLLAVFSDSSRAGGRRGVAGREEEQMLSKMISSQAPAMALLPLLTERAVPVRLRSWAGP